MFKNMEVKANISMLQPTHPAISLVFRFYTNVNRMNRSLFISIGWSGGAINLQVVTFAMGADISWLTVCDTMSLFMTLGAEQGNEDLCFLLQGPRHSLLMSLVAPSSKYRLEGWVSQQLTQVLLSDSTPLPHITVDDNVSLMPTSDTQSQLSKFIHDLSKCRSPNVLLRLTFVSLFGGIRILFYLLVKGGNSTLTSSTPECTGEPFIPNSIVHCP